MIKTRYFPLRLCKVRGLLAMIEFFFCNYYLMMLKEMNIYIFRKGALIGKIRNVLPFWSINSKLSHFIQLL